MRPKGIIKNKTLNLIAFILSLGPILDPYIISELSGVDIKLMYLISFIGVMVILLSKDSSGINTELILLVSIVSILTILTFIFPQGNRSLFMALKNIIIWTVLSGIVGVMWKNFDYAYFVKCSYIIASVAIIILFIQFISLNIGITSVFDGKIPFLNLSKYDDWSPMYNAAGEIRVHSLFQEPSYLSIFLLPLFADSIKRTKYIYSLIFLVSIFITTSSVGIVGVFVIILHDIFRKSETNMSKSKFKLILVFIMSLGVIYLLYLFNDNIRETIDFSLGKIIKIRADLEGSRMGSTKLRLVGNFELFNYLNFYFKTFGLGAAQYVSYFELPISYSSTMVTTLLNYGIVGIIVFFIWLIKLSKKYCKNDKIYLLIFVMICFVDQFWFNWYFFYILTWVVMGRDQLRKEI